NDNNNAKVSFKKYAELLNSDNVLAKFQLFHLEYLLNKTSSKDLNNILTKINQNLENYNYRSKLHELLYFIKCKIYIELKKYGLAKIVLSCIEFAVIGYFKQNHPDFWYEVCEIDENNLTKFGGERKVYFVSNLTNLNSELCQFQESDTSSLSGLVLSSKNENLHLVLPKQNGYRYRYFICKMNVKKILSKDCFIKFIDGNKNNQDLLKHEDISKLEGLGWIEYQTRIRDNSQLSIDINFIEMQIEYIRSGDNKYTITHIPDMSLMGYLPPDYHIFFSNIPETFKDKYFSRKEMENLLDLKDILNSL
ncbi:hypothetical protein RhiirA4_473913, partial [Rhizophagus irregularis]